MYPNNLNATTSYKKVQGSSVAKFFKYMYDGHISQGINRVGAGVYLINGPSTMFYMGEGKTV